jgi:hypothetical protein
MIKGTRRSPYPRRSSSKAFPVAVVAALLLASGVFFFRSHLFPEREAPAEAEPASAHEARELPPTFPGTVESRAELETEAAAPSPAPEPAPLPALAESDPLIRELAADASARPELRDWLTASELVRRFVAGVANVANGDSPRGQLLLLTPEEPFRVVEQEGRVVADPASHARYDAAAEVVASLHVPTAVRAYHVLEPLFEEAFADLGIPDQSFEETLDQAIRELLRAPRIEGAAELRRVGSFYEYPDEELEGASSAQRHLLRMGPRNALRVQEKLREIRSALGLAEDER